MPQKDKKERAQDVDKATCDYVAFSDDIDPINTPADKETPNADQIRITQLEEELVSTKDYMIRTVAEAENRRKQALKEREHASKFAVTGLSRDLLSVADNLRRALDAMPADLLKQHPQMKGLTDGIEATERELLRAFEKHGIQKTNPINERFDPHFHEVMFESPMPDKDNGTIINVIEPGYILNGRILRPARVGIAKNDLPQKKEDPSSPGQTINTEV